MACEDEHDHFDFPGRIYDCEGCNQATNDLQLVGDKWLCPFCRGDCLRTQE